MKIVQKVKSIITGIGHQRKPTKKVQFIIGNLIALCFAVMDSLTTTAATTRNRATLNRTFLHNDGETNEATCHEAGSCVPCATDSSTRSLNLSVKTIGADAVDGCISQHSGDSATFKRYIREVSSGHLQDPQQRFFEISRSLSYYTDYYHRTSRQTNNNAFSTKRLSRRAVDTVSLSSDKDGRLRSWLQLVKLLLKLGPVRIQRGHMV